MSSKFHGSLWEELLNDYGLRQCDMTTVRLEHYGTMIGVDFHRDGVMLFPLPCVGKLFVGLIFSFVSIYTFFCFAQFVKLFFVALEDLDRKSVV